MLLEYITGFLFFLTPRPGPFFPPLLLSHGRHFPSFPFSLDHPIDQLSSPPPSYLPTSFGGIRRGTGVLVRLAGGDSTETRSRRNSGREHLSGVAERSDTHIHKKPAPRLLVFMIPKPSQVMGRPCILFVGVGREMVFLLVFLVLLSVWELLELVRHPSHGRDSSWLPRFRPST